MVDISIIIITYNSENYIEDCVKSVIENTQNAKYEIIIWDNNSQDNTLKKIEILVRDYNNIIVVKNQSNLGFAKAVNNASELAKGRYLFLLNPDTLLLNNAIDILYEKALMNPSISVLGGRLSDKNGKYIFSCGFLPDVKEIIYLLSNHKHLIKQKKIKITEEQNVELISGCDFIIRKDIFDLFGRFDEDYFLYYEELDLCFKLKKAGHKCLFVPQANIIHYVMKSEENEYLTNSYNYTGAYLYCKKNFNIKYLIIMRIIFTLLSLYTKNNIKNLEKFKTNILFIWKN